MYQAAHISRSACPSQPVRLSLSVSASRVSIIVSASLCLSLSASAFALASLSQPLFSRLRISLSVSATCIPQQSLCLNPSRAD